MLEELAQGPISGERIQNALLMVKAVPILTWERREAF